MGPPEEFARHVAVAVIHGAAVTWVAGVTSLAGIARVSDVAGVADAFVDNHLVVKLPDIRAGKRVDRGSIELADRFATHRVDVAALDVAERLSVLVVDVIRHMIRVRAGKDAKGREPTCGLLLGIELPVSRDAVCAHHPNYSASTAIAPNK
jgi:hypothetical protein